MARAMGTLSGDRELAAKFARLSKTAQGKTLVRAAVAGALPIQNDAKINAPYQTGNLKRSIHIGGHEDLAPDRGDIVDSTGERVPHPEVDSDTAAVYVGTDVVYAPPVEYGGKGRRPHPFLRKAADERREDAVREVGEAYRDLVRAAVRS